MSGGQLTAPSYSTVAPTRHTSGITHLGKESGTDGESVGRGEGGWTPAKVGSGTFACALPISRAWGPVVSIHSNTEEKRNQKIQKCRSLALQQGEGDASSKRPIRKRKPQESKITLTVQHCSTAHQPVCVFICGSVKASCFAGTLYPPWTRVIRAAHKRGSIAGGCRLSGGEKGMRDRRCNSRMPSGARQ